MRRTTRPLRTVARLAAAALLGATALALASPAPTGARAPASAEAPAPTDRLIVTFAPATAAGVQSADRQAELAAQLSADAGAELTYLRPLDAATHLLALAGPRPYDEVAALARRLVATSAVLSAEPDTLVFPTREPTDNGYAQFAWHLKPVGGGSYGANLPAAWTITTGSPAIVAAIVDTGGLLDHEDLAGRTPAGNPGYDMIGELAKANDGDGRDPDPSDPGDYVTTAEAVPGCSAHDSTWHGSHVAGTIGARANNGRGMAGVSWESPLLHIRALGKCGGYISDIADGLRWAAGLQVGGLPLNPNPARVLNLSLGGSGACSGYFQAAVDDAVARGAVVVVAAGNENRSASGSTPGNCANLITVAATAQDGGRAGYSNYGATVELAAPGGDTSRDSAVYSTIDSGRFGPEADAYDFYQGTSMATPHVAGIASLMLSVNPGLSSADVLAILQSTATAFPAGSGCAGVCGAGIANAGAAVEEAARRVRTASFQADSVVTAEGATAISIPLTLSVASNQSVSVPYTVSGSAGASDHNLATGSLTFAPGATTASLNLVITDDGLAEEDETILLSLGPGARSGLGALSSFSVTVKDNDARPAVDLSPGALSFGELRVGAVSASQLITVSNVGELPLTIGGIAASGNYARAGGSCPTVFPATLTKGGNCTVAVQFAPTRLGLRTGSLTVASNVLGGSSSAVLSGVGVIPALGFGPTVLRFPALMVGGSAPTGTLTLTNPGTAPLRIDAIAASGDYSYGGASCAAVFPATLAPGASCIVQVGFTPQAGGARAGALTVSGDVPGGPYSARLLGESLAPELVLDAASLNFGGQQAGTSAAARTVVIANSGDAPLRLSSIGVSGAAFARAGGSCPTSLPSTLAPGASCTVQVGFSPAAAQAYAGALSVDSDGGAVEVALSGVGTLVPAASPQLSPAALVFEDRVLPAATGARSLTVSNQGALIMTIGALTVGGAGFSISGGSCGASPIVLAPGAGCSVELSLTAGATGAYSGTLTVTSDAPGGPQVAALKGAVVASAGAFSLEDVGLDATPDTMTLRFTAARSLPADGAASVAYTITADRELANGDLIVAAGSVAFGAGETSKAVAVTLDRLALYGARALVLDLGEPVEGQGLGPAASRSVPLPADGYRLYAPVVLR